MVDDFVEALAVPFGFLQHAIGVAFFVYLPDAVLADERDCFPRAERVLDLERRPVALDLFVAELDRFLSFAEQCLALDDIVDREVLCLGLLLVHLDRVGRVRAPLRARTP